VGRGAPRKQALRGKVYLVGAGPGDPELLAVKALRVLRRAEVVLHDALISPDIFALIPARVTLLNVGKRCGQKSLTQEQIHSLLVSHAGRGQCVVRLKGGDPMIFGRAGEEISALRKAGIPFEIIPGISAVLGAAACAQVPLTDRRIASTLVLAAGHHADGAAEAAPSALPTRTVVLYMPGTDLAKITRDQKAAGLASETPCLIASQVCTVRQRFYRTTLGQLSEAPVLQAPTLLIIGEVTRLSLTKNSVRPDPVEPTSPAV
jgi:uroporphyrin-III C-methyltransferase